MASWKGKKGNVVFSKPEEPSFLKQFKEKVGYKGDSGVTDKFQVMPKASDEDLEDGDDEQPQVVQLQPGDLTQEEYEAEIAKETAPNSHKEPDGQDGDPPPDAKILFRKPEKRAHDTGFERTTSTKKKRSEEDGEADQKEEEVKKGKKEKKKADRKLLSFDDEDEEDDDS